MSLTWYGAGASFKPALFTTWRESLMHDITVDKQPQRRRQPTTDQLISSPSASALPGSGGAAATASSSVFFCSTTHFLTSSIDSPCCSLVMQVSAQELTVFMCSSECACSLTGRICITCRPPRSRMPTAPVLTYLVSMNVDVLTAGPVSHFFCWCSMTMLMIVQLDVF